MSLIYRYVDPDALIQTSVPEPLTYSNWDTLGTSANAILDNNTWTNVAGFTLFRLRVVAGVDGCPTPNMLEHYYQAGDSGSGAGYVVARLGNGLTATQGTWYTTRWYQRYVHADNFLGGDHPYSWTATLQGNGARPWVEIGDAGSPAGFHSYAFFTNSASPGARYSFGAGGTVANIPKEDWLRMEASFRLVTGSTYEARLGVWDASDVELAGPTDFVQTIGLGDGTTNITEVVHEIDNDMNPVSFVGFSGGWDNDPTVGGIAAQFAAVALWEAGTGAEPSVWDVPYDPARGW